MGITRKEAYEILELPNGADADSVRTAYKRLAIKWSPERVSASAAATTNFKKISLAYKKLSDEDFDTEDELEMPLDEMYRLLQRTLNPGEFNNANGYDSSEDDDDDDDYAFYANNLKTLRQGAPGSNLTAEEIERNANELITEEEKEKRKAEKRRAKKKRQREKKRQEKEQQKKEEEQNKKGSGKQNGEIKSESKKNKKDKKNKDSSASDGEEFDESAAFFTKVVNKKKKAGILPDATTNGKAKTKEKTNTANKEEENMSDLVLRSRKLAIRGNQMANAGHYQAAIDLFTEAIKLDPKDFRFFGNRSYCYDRLQNYDRALRDADKAISIAPDWPKGYFRKGRALAGLKEYGDAETAFTQVLKLDRNCEEAITEQSRVRTLQLQEMGFSRQQAEAAIKQYSSVQQALDSLLAGHTAESSLAGEVFMSDEDDDTPVPTAVQHVPIMTSNYQTAHQNMKGDVKMDSSNPEGLTALWVGNVLREVTEDKLKAMFSKYGTVTSVRCLPDKYCAFINYKSKESAGKAMCALQGHECAGQRLLIKFPDNPIVNGNVVLGKTPSTKSVIQEDPKVTGPVNGDECYFWRTTGCIYGDNCRYRHLPSSKGIDRKPWQKSAL